MFPQNRDFPDRRVPYFIDADGTACAVGHLMIASGDQAIAREIATYENNDFLADIEHPGVAGWLVRNGITAEEAAWIQPQYGLCEEPGNPNGLPPVCGVDGKSYACDEAADECDVLVKSEGLCPGDSLNSIVGCPDEGSTGKTSTSEEPASGDDEKGCRVADPPPAAALVLFVAYRRRRRTA